MEHVFFGRSKSSAQLLLPSDTNSPYRPRRQYNSQHLRRYALVPRYFVVRVVDLSELEPHEWPEKEQRMLLQVLRDHGVSRHNESEDMSDSDEMARIMEMKFGSWPVPWRNTDFVATIPKVFTLDMRRLVGPNSVKLGRALCHCDSCWSWYQDMLSQYSEPKFCITTTTDLADFGFYRPYSKDDWPTPTEIKEHLENMKQREQKWTMITCIGRLDSLMNFSAEGSIHLLLPHIGDPTRMPCFTIRAFSEDDPSRRHFPHEAVVTDVDSSESWEQAQDWFSECQEHHESCRASDDDTAHTDFCPTRLLDVGLDSNTLALVQRHDQPTTGVKYLALSYCWGSGAVQAYCTTSENLTNRCNQGFPLDQQPATIRDAVRTTQMLGFRFLWVDALCILQDDLSDKMIEISAMHQVYRHAALLISASRASAVTDGFLQQVNHLEVEIYEFRSQIPFRYRGEGGEKGAVILGTKEEVTIDHKPIFPDPLHCRAWTMQESLLSKRILAFGITGMRWQCFECSRYGSSAHSVRMDASEILANPSGLLCRKFVRSRMHLTYINGNVGGHADRQEESEENGYGRGEGREMSVEDESELGVEDEGEIEGEGFEEFPSRGSSMVAEVSGSLQLQSPRSPRSPRSPQSPQSPQLPGLPGLPEFPGLPQLPQLPGLPQSPETEPPPTPYVFSAESEGKSDLDDAEAEWTDTESELDDTESGLDDTESEPDLTYGGGHWTGVDKYGSNWDETSQETGWGVEAVLSDHSESLQTFSDAAQLKAMGPIYFGYRDEWDHLRSTFCLREITNATDRLPALSAVSRELEHIFGNDSDTGYAAGHWLCHLPSDLMWEGISRDRFGDFPTWSYVSGYGYECTFFEADNGAEETAAVRAAEIDLVNPDDPFGDVRAARLLICGHLLPVRLRFGLNDSNGSLSICDSMITTPRYVPVVSKAEVIRFKGTMDPYYISLGEESLQVLGKQSCFLLEIQRGDPCSRGLIIRRRSDITDQNCPFYYRIGTFELGYPSRESVCERPGSLFQYYKKQLLYLV